MRIASMLGEMSSAEGFANRRSISLRTASAFSLGFENGRRPNKSQKRGGADHKSHCQGASDAFRMRSRFSPMPHRAPLPSEASSSYAMTTESACESPRATQRPSVDIHRARPKKITSFSPSDAPDHKPAPDAENRDGYRSACSIYRHDPAVPAPPADLRSIPASGWRRNVAADGDER